MRRPRRGGSAVRVQASLCPGQKPKARAPFWLPPPPPLINTRRGGPLVSATQTAARIYLRSNESRLQQRPIDPPIDPWRGSLGCECRKPSTGMDQRGWACAGGRPAMGAKPKEAPPNAQPRTSFAFRPSKGVHPASSTSTGVGIDQASTRVELTSCLPVQEEGGSM